MDQPFYVELWLSIKNVVRRLVRPALFLFPLLFVYGYGRESLSAEDYFLIVVLALFAFVVVLLDVLEDDPDKAVITVRAITAGSVLALTIPIADHMKVGRQMSAAAETEKNMTKVKQIEAVVSALGDDRFPRVNADGSIEVVDSAEMEREHAIKLLKERVLGYQNFVGALGRHSTAEAVDQVMSRMNVNELLGVKSPSPEAGTLLEGSDISLHGSVGTNGSPAQPS